jgi:NAD(P)-dependent dehydrogenase (short-subunit alcohol dehydrogenase family)
MSAKHKPDATRKQPTFERFSLQDRVAIVTGACGLIGREHCIAMLEAGAKLVALDLSQRACDALAVELGERFGADNVMAAAADITDKAALEAVRDRVLGTWDRIDVLVNNAAINDMFENPEAAADLSRFERYPLELWQRSLSANITGTFLCAQVFGTVMAERGNGSIINVASTYGMVAPDQSLYIKPDGTQDFFKSPAYPTTKGAVIAFTRFLAAYWGKAGVRVNTLSPGGVENGQDDYFVDAYSKRTPLDRMARADDYRGAVVFLASDASSYVTGSNLVVDGGWTAW